MTDKHSINNTDGNIHFFLDDILDTNNSEASNTDFEIEEQQIYNNEIAVPQIINYNENFTVKELLIICEYYGFLKEIKNNKCNKEQIIEILVNFENEKLMRSLKYLCNYRKQGELPCRVFYLLKQYNHLQR